MRLDVMICSLKDRMIKKDLRYGMSIDWIVTKVLDGGLRDGDMLRNTWRMRAWGIRATCSHPPHSFWISRKQMVENGNFAGLRWKQNLR